MQLHAMPFAGRVAALSILSVALIGAVAVHAIAQEHKAPSPAAASIDDFAWLTGTWEGLLDVGDGMALAEVQYLVPRAGTILGSFRLTKDEAVLVMEMLAMVEVEGGIEMRMRHFSKSLDPWEDGDPLILTFDSVREGVSIFRNHVNDSPRWSYLEALGPNSFSARSEIYSDTGEVSEIKIVYERRLATPR